MTTKDWGLLLTLSLLWGGSFFFTEIALQEATPLLTVWARVSLAAVLLWIYLIVTRQVPERSLSLWMAFFVMGVLNNAVPFYLIVWAQTEITSSLAAILNATTPLFTLILTQFLTHDEKLSWQKSIALCIGFMGVILMVGADALDGIGKSVYAQIGILGAAISYGLAAIWGRRFKGLSPLTAATGQVTCSSLVMTPLVLTWGIPNGFFIPSLDVTIALFGLAFFCTVIAYGLYFKILATSGATNLMLVTFLVPVSALGLGVAFLNERLSLTQIIGMTCILVTLLIIDGRVFKKKAS